MMNREPMPETLVTDWELPRRRAELENAIATIRRQRDGYFTEEAWKAMLDKYEKALAELEEKERNDAGARLADCG